MSDALDSILLERFSAQSDPIAPPDFADVRRRARSLGAPAPRRRWRRRTLVAVAVGALVFAGTATAVAVHYFGGSTRYTVIPLTPGSTVPGLAGFAPLLLPDSSGPSPTAAQCAEAWNAQAPRPTLRWMATQQTAGVRIGVAAARTADSGLGHGALCLVYFFLDGDRTLMAQGPWEGDGVPRWQGGLRALPAPMRSALERSANGDVHADGTIGCRLRCDTRAPVPSPSVTPTEAPAASAGVPDACTLLTPAEVEDVLGRTPRNRTADPGRGSSACIWHDGPLTSLANVTLSLSVTRMAKAEFERAMSNQSRARPVDGLGDAAYVFRDGELLTVWQKGFALTVVNRTDTPLETARGVASAALARLSPG